MKINSKDFRVHEGEQVGELSDLQQLHCATERKQSLCSGRNYAQWSDVKGVARATARFLDPRSLCIVMADAMESTRQASR